MHKKIIFNKSTYVKFFLLYPCVFCHFCTKKRPTAYLFFLQKYFFPSEISVSCVSFFFYHVNRQCFTAFSVLIIFPESAIVKKNHPTFSDLWRKTFSSLGYEFFFVNFPVLVFTVPFPASFHNKASGFFPRPRCFW